MMPCPPPNCIAWRTARPNPDISGIGVLLGFAASAYLTLAFCVAYYLVSDDETTESSEAPPATGKQSSIDRPNPVDQAFKKKIASWWTSTGNLYSESWSQAFHDAVLFFSDQQSLTGIAILVSGFSQLACSLSAYHWQLTFDLAWFSSITHLTTLTCLRHYFQIRPALRVWRLVCMAITAVMLSVALIPTGYLSVIGPRSDPSFPAWCLYHHDLWSQDSGNFDDSYDGWYIGITLVFLAFSYSSRVIQLFPAAMAVTYHWPPVRPSYAFHSWLLSLKKRAHDSSSILAKMLWVLLYNLFCPTWYALRAMADLWSSLLWEITWLSIALAWGTIRIVRDRRNDEWQYGFTPRIIDESQENQWGFGQVIAMILLIAPFVAFFEVSYGECLFFNITLEAGYILGRAYIFSIEALSKTKTTVTSGHHRTNSNNDLGASNDFASQCVTRIAIDDHESLVSNANPRTTQLQHNLDAYSHRWFWKMIMLIYCLCLAIVAYILYEFPYLGAIRDLQYSGSGLPIQYGGWLAKNMAIVWIFAFVGVLSMETNPVLNIIIIRKVRTRVAALKNRLKQSFSPKVWAWIDTVTWSCLILGLSGASGVWGTMGFWFVFDRP